MLNSSIQVLARSGRRDCLHEFSSKILTTLFLRSTHQQRFFSKPTKQRRKSPSLQSLKQRQSQTIKNKIRSRQTTMTNRRMVTIDAELMAERLVTRLEWAKESLTAFWKDSSTTSSTKQQGGGGRPLRYELKMDANWWFWNLLLAASPSILIALYCEFVAKPEMERQVKANASIASVASSTSSTDVTADTTNHNMSMADSWALFVDWIQGKERPPPPPSPKQESDHAAQVSNHPQWQKLQELKQQIVQLETEMKKGKVDSSTSDHHAPQNHSRRSSPIYQRNMMRINQLPNTQTSSDTSLSMTSDHDEKNESSPQDTSSHDGPSEVHSNKKDDSDGGHDDENDSIIAKNRPKDYSETSTHEDEPSVSTRWKNKIQTAAKWTWESLRLSSHPDDNSRGSSRHPQPKLNAQEKKSESDSETQEK